MRYHNNGSAYTVTYSREDALAFARQWPCSTPGGTDGMSGIPGESIVTVVDVALPSKGEMPRYAVAWPVPDARRLWVYEDALERG